MQEDQHVIGLGLLEDFGDEEVELGVDRLAALGREVFGDKSYAGREFEAAARELGVTIVRSRRKDEPGTGPHLAPIRRRVE